MESPPSLDNLKVGDIIELPNLGERPMELGNEKDQPLLKVLMTQQRLDNIKEVARELEFGKEDYSSGAPNERGKIISGPMGSERPFSPTSPPLSHGQTEL
jgi:hypothetical protein